MTLNLFPSEQATCEGFIEAEVERVKGSMEVKISIVGKIMAITSEIRTVLESASGNRMKLVRKGIILMSKRVIVTFLIANILLVTLLSACGNPLATKPEESALAAVPMETPVSEDQQSSVPSIKTLTSPKTGKNGLTYYATA
ncbi:MAG: hypothetical protein FWE91_12310 [Defluviitaleaceae bacterium]|nr:hypothetical protein [Defluviitaleaceae bacterium]MCL2836533.1 hypothetical protein [Defluviitaleaceae bacterium]